MKDLQRRLSSCLSNIVKMRSIQSAKVGMLPCGDLHRNVTATLLPCMMTLHKPESCLFIYIVATMLRGFKVEQ